MNQHEKGFPLVDCRGFSCPQPVLMTRAALESSAGAAGVETLVDTQVAAGNVRRMAEKAGWSVAEDRGDDGIRLRITRKGVQAAIVSEAVPEPADGGSRSGKKTVLFVNSDRMGQGDDELGQVLARSFFHTLLELENPPETILFVNSGVRLTVSDSPVLDDLQELAGRGVEILSCGTCLNFFGLTDSLQVGEVTNMFAIVEVMMVAGKVMTL